ncbi:MAG: hypothetical protein ACSHW2_04320 [Parasphingopyxis sp.]
MALLVAPLVPALLLALWSSTPENFKNVFAIMAILAELSAIVLGFPAVLILRNKIRPRLVWALLFGGVIAALPWLFFGLLPGSGQASLGGVDTVVDGQLTWFGLSVLLKSVGVTFLLGTIGGAIFWMIAVWPDIRINPVEDSDD